MVEERINQQNHEMTSASLGKFLKSKRLDKNVSLSTISHQTKISTNALESIEEGQFGNLHGDVFVRGFLRSYSECLGLDAKDVVEKYASCQDTLEPAPVSVAEKKGFLALLNKNNVEQSATFKQSLSAPFDRMPGQSMSPMGAHSEHIAIHDTNEEPQKNLLFMAAAFLMLGSIALMSYWMVASGPS